jgi:hypothetical protein
LLLSRAAVADGVTILRVPSSNGPLDERLAAELSTLGLPVQELQAADPAATLEQLAAARGARAAVRVLGDDRAIELWVAPRTESAPPVHQLVPVEPRRGWNLAVVSALEILRADLLEIRQPTSRPPPAAAPPRSPPPGPAHGSAQPYPPLVWAYVAAGAQTSPGGLGPSAELLAELRLDMPGWVGIGGLATVSPAAKQVTGPEGASSVRHALFGAVVDVRGRSGLVTGSIGAGGVLALFWMNGEPLAPGYAGRSASSTTAGPVLRGCGALDVTRALRVRVQFLVGSALQSASILFAGREVAGWGQPFALVTLGLEAGL